MCLWVQAPHIPVRYILCSERIVPRADGGLTVVADILLENKSPSEFVTDLLLIYPHAFPLVAVPTHEGGQWHLGGAFKDRSLSLRDRQDEDNRLYVASGWLTPTNPVETSDHIGLNIKLPDPNNADQYAEYDGTLPANNELRPGWDGMEESQWRALTAIDYAIWRCHLDISMKPGEQRWFRWELTSVPSKFNCRSRWVRILQWIAGRRKFDHTISGPLNVRDGIFARLQVLRSHARDETTVGASSKLIKLLTDLGTYDYCPEVADWRINLSPGLYPRINNLTQQGITIAGHQPNVLSYEHVQDCPGLPLREKLYQWKTGEVHGTPEARFSIYFDWVLHSSWHTLLPWAALLMSAASLAAAIIALLK